MVFTDVGRKFVALILGSDLNTFIAYVGLGTGSATALVGDSVLVTEINRIAITGSPNFATAQKVTFQADFNSVQMSGTASIKEFGLTETASGTNFTGSMWQREGFPGITFDGTNELQVVTTISVL